MTIANTLAGLKHDAYAAHGLFEVLPWRTLLRPNKSGIWTGPGQWSVYYTWRKCEAHYSLRLLANILPHHDQVCWVWNSSVQAMKDSSTSSALKSGTITHTSNPVLNLLVLLIVYNKSNSMSNMS